MSYVKPIFHNILALIKTDAGEPILPNILN